MKAHIAYLSYVIRHKWFVLLACRQTGCSFWQGLIHDISKFSRREWFPYVHSFFNSDGTRRGRNDTNGSRDPITIKAEFDMAWLSHQHHNPHHWQYWILRQENGEARPLPIPEKYIREMVADWMGAGRAITGKWEYQDWYSNNKHKMQLNPTSQAQIELLIYKGTT